MQGRHNGTPRASHHGAANSRQFGPFSKRQREGNGEEDAGRNDERDRPGGAAAQGSGPERRRGSNQREPSDHRSDEPARGQPQESAERKRESHGHGTHKHPAKPAYPEVSDSSTSECTDETCDTSSDSYSQRFGTSSEDCGCTESQETECWDRTTECDWGSSGFHDGPIVPQFCPDQELLHSIALEELAIAHLINAEAEKAQAVARQKLSPLTPDELIEFQHSIAKVLEMVVEKEKLLLKKLRLLLYKSSRCCDDDSE